MGQEQAQHQGLAADPLERRRRRSLARAVWLCQLHLGSRFMDSNANVWCMIKPQANCQAERSSRVTAFLKLEDMWVHEKGA
jgi:hypothetical protein